jgi:uncharacterized protein YfkK (UPF0435 family)
MKHLINRDEYIKEYLRIVNQELITNNSNQVENENELMRVCWEHYLED